MTDTTADEQPARFRWLPPGLRPKVAMTWRQERIFLLVGVAALFAGYDMNVFGLALPQIQKGLNIPENAVGLTVAIFRLAAFPAMLLVACADLVGRRRLLLVTILGQALATLATAFTITYGDFLWAQLVTRIFGYAEEMLCLVVIAEEVAATARGWATGTLGALDYLGAGVASLVFAGVNLLPYGWRALYVIGAIPLFLVAYLRRKLPETRRFAERETRAVSKAAEAFALLKALLREYPLRLFTVLCAAGAFGFAVSPATVLTSKYLQTVRHYTPGDTTLLFIPGGLVGLALAIHAGRLSDRFGRRPFAIGITAIAGIGFALLYSGVPDWAVPPLWILSFFGFFSGDALIAGFALEIMPTRYRATVSGLRYLVEIGLGAVALALEGHLFDHYHAHGPAIRLTLLALPVTLIALWLLPEPAGKSLEEMAG